jgi:hypothetical protein
VGCSAWSSVLFVCQDDDQRETFLNVAERTHRTPLATSDDRRATSAPDAAGRSS